MNKELTPLEALKTIIMWCDEEMVKNELKIMKNALKDYEELKQINIERSKQILELVSEQTENSKKVKAIEIIKENLVNVCDEIILRCDYEEYLDYYKEYCSPDIKKLKKEEWVLLKEIFQGR